jgi:hypothetical protein
MLRGGTFLKNRTLLSVLITMVLLYYGLPQLSMTGGNLEVAFSIGWICFAIIVIGGNLAEYLYQSARKKKVVKKQLIVEPSREKQRMF